MSLGDLETPGQLTTPSPSPPAELSSRRRPRRHQRSQFGSPDRSHSQSRSRSRDRHRGLRGDGNSQHHPMATSHRSPHHVQNQSTHSNSYDGGRRSIDDSSSPPFNPPGGPAGGPPGGPPSDPPGSGNSPTRDPSNNPVGSGNDPTFDPSGYPSGSHRPPVIGPGHSRQEVPSLPYHHNDQHLAHRHQNLEAYMHYKDANKFNVKITGDADENLMNKIFDLEQWQNMTQSSDDAVYRLLLSKGLGGRAKDRIRQQQRQNPHKVRTKDDIINILVLEFNWERYTKKLFSEYRGQKQKATQIQEYYREFVAKYDDMTTTFDALRDRLPPWQTKLLVSPTPIEAYRVFINSLNVAARDRILSYIQLQHVDADIEALHGAVDYVQGVLHPYGLKDAQQTTDHSRRPNRASRSRSSRNSRGNRSRPNETDSKPQKSNRWERRKQHQNDRKRSRSNRRNGTRNGGGKDDRTCYECGKKGHIAKDCYSKTTESNKSSVTCYKCGKKGHYARKCKSDSSNSQNGSESTTTSNRNNSKLPRPSKKKHSNLVHRAKGVHFINAPRMPFPSTVIDNGPSPESSQQRPPSNVPQHEMNNVVFERTSPQ